LSIHFLCVDLKNSNLFIQVFGPHFQLPELGPIGANGLANPHCFQLPVAWFEDRDCAFQMVSKFQGVLFTAEQVL
jgi:homogentisate 1,2-dioxygenase